MLDRDLAELYGAEVKRLNELVKRNWNRPPEEFCFKPNSSKLAPQNDKLPLVFTEQGAYALSFVLSSSKQSKWVFLLLRPSLISGDLFSKMKTS
jgi:hypothetical protein